MPVSFLVWPACVTSARDTALAMSTAWPGLDEVAETPTIGASGEVATCTLSRSVAAGTPAATCASPSTASCGATRPYACAKPSASAQSTSDRPAATATTELVAVYCGGLASPYAPPAAAPSSAPAGSSHHEGSRLARVRARRGSRAR
jgi:hypothetical protein